METRQLTPGVRKRRKRTADGSHSSCVDRGTLSLTYVQDWMKAYIYKRK